MTYLERARRSIKEHEGYRSHVYKDTVGKLTVGYGTHLYEGRYVSPMICDDLFEGDVRTALDDAQWFADLWWPDLSDARKAVLIDMAYNLGRDRLGSFVKFRRALQSGDYAEAAAQMLDSRWAQQVGQRAHNLAERMQEG